jgi:hypothetical protein
MYGVINCDASLSCAGNGAFESTEGPADATEGADLAFLHQGAIRFDIQWTPKVHTDVLHHKQATQWSKEGQKGSGSFFVIQGNPESRPEARSVR